MTFDLYRPCALCRVRRSILFSRKPRLTRYLALAASFKSARIGSDENRGREKAGKVMADTNL